MVAVTALAGHVGQEDQPGLIAQALLLHRPDRHPVIAKDPGHRGQDPGAVSHVDADVVRRPQVVQGREARAACAARGRGGRLGRR